MGIDKFMSARANARFATLYNATINELESITKFSHLELSSILIVYYKFVRQNGARARYMTRLQFISFFLLFSENYDMRIVHRVAYLVGEGKQFIKPTAFVKYLTIIFGHDLEERLAFAFKVYDTRSEGILSGAVLAAAVENFFTEGEEDELTAMRSDMVEILLKKFDKYSEGGGSITFDRYRNVVLKSPDLLEFLGKIYPSRSQAILIAHCMNILTEIPRMTCK